MCGRISAQWMRSCVPRETFFTGVKIARTRIMGCSANAGGMRKGENVLEGGRWDIVDVKKKGDAREAGEFKLPRPTFPLYTSGVCYNFSSLDRSKLRVIYWVKGV